MTKVQGKVKRRRGRKAFFKRSKGDCRSNKIVPAKSTAENAQEVPKRTCTTDNDVVSRAENNIATREDNEEVVEEIELEEYLATLDEVVNDEDDHVENESDDENEGVLPDDSTVTFCNSRIARQYAILHLWSQR